MSMLQPPAADELAELTRLHRDARYLDAYHHAQRFSAPEEWTETEAILLAGRLYSCWGDWPRSNRLHVKAWKGAPQDPAAIYFHCLTVEHKHGPFEALRFLHEHRTVIESPSPAPYHVWIWLRLARLRATFRDFDGAEALIARAEPHGAHDSWFWVERARLRQQQDRYDDALADAQRALEINPWYRPAIETLADFHMLLNRDEDAIALLSRSIERLQAANLAQMLSALLNELDRHEEALEAHQRATEWMPCPDRTVRRWLAARRSDLLRALGRDAEAAESAQQVKSEFHDHIAARLSAPPPQPARRVLLPVKFVRQHHMTCAPATLAALSNFWQRPVDHAELARTICYDGTPDHEERHWAESNGWVAREFRVTWDAAVALLVRGCPFTLTTVATRSAHLQAVIGFDERLGLLLIRDPYQRTHGECRAQEFLAECASHGPRGMVLVPAGQASLLEGIELAEASLYDAWYTLRRALVRHDRVAAQGALEPLQSNAPGHRLTLHAQRELALYDGNLLRQLEVTRALLALFPENPNFLLDEAQLLRALGHAQERRERVAALGRKASADPLYLREYAEMLTEDARLHPTALRVARRTLRRHPVEAGNLRAFAHLLWFQRRFDEATELYRLAACVGDKLEQHWDSFFSASRHTQRVDTCLQLLRQREARLGQQSSQPVRTLFRAYETLDHTPDGFAALEHALERRPDDGELLLFAAESHGRFGRFERAAQLVGAARDRVPQALWLRTNARLAEFQSQHVTALAHWRDLLGLAPIDLAAHSAIASLMAITESRAAAIDFLRESCARQPSQVPLHRMLLEWLRSEPAAQALPVVDHLLALDPNDAWTLREKALVLARDHRAEEALVCATTARQVEPTSPYSPAVQGVAFAALGRDADARRAFEEALVLGIDCGYMDDLLRTCHAFDERKAAIAFLHAELVRQPVAEAGAFLRYRELARAVLTPAELRTALETLMTVHPGQWAVWSALCTHLADQGELESALARGREMADRFPLVPRVWVELAAVQSRASQSAAEIESLRRALELSPAWGYAGRELALAHERALQLDEAEHSLRRVIAGDPVDGWNYTYLGDLLWRRRRPEEALAAIERAIALDPGIDMAWQRLDGWSRELKRPGHALERARAITTTRAGDARAWLRLARLQLDKPEEAMPDLERAIALEPRNAQILDLRVQILSALGRHDEAIAGCRPAAFGATPPRELLGRAAWITHERGNTPAAIEQMQAVVKAHPDYEWGWAALTEWLWEASKFAEAAEAGTTWSWLSPDSAVPLGYVAAAQQRMGQRREARATYWRALQRVPAYGYGAQMLLQLLAEDRELEEAARVLRHIEVHLSPADAQRAAVLYHIMRRDRTAAATTFSQLAAAPEEKMFLLDEAARALAEAGWHDTAADALAPLLAKPGTSAAVGRVWANLWARSSRWSEIWLLDQKSAPEPVQRKAWSAALENAGRQKAAWWLRWFRFRRGKWFRTSSDTWGAMGYAYVTMHHARAAIRWMHDWRQRSDIEPWMLHNLALAHFQRNDPDAALAIVEHALTLKPDSLRPGFLLWRGIERVLRGDLPGALADQAEIPANADLEDLKFSVGVLVLLIQFEKALPQSPKDALREAKAALKQHWSTAPGVTTDPSTIHLRARVLRHLGRAAGSPWTRLQGYVAALGRHYTFARQNPWAAVLIIYALIAVIGAFVGS